MTNVPAIQFTSAGVVVPKEADILTGVQLDMNTAFGGNLNASLETPQGQLATSQSAVIAVAYAALANLVTKVDPAYSSGRYQDAIGRLYNLTRKPSVSTVIQVTCSGLSGATIPVGALVSDPLKNIYSCTQQGIISASGSIVLPFANTVPGALSVPTSVAVYQMINGWDSATLVSGVIGQNTESASAFEARRQLALAKNSNNQNASMLGAILAVPNVLSAYVTDNSNSYPSVPNIVSSVVGTISGTVLTVTSGSNVAVGQFLGGVLGLLDGTSIQSLGTGTGGTGTYNLNQSQPTIGSSTFSLGNISVNAKALYACVSGGLTASVATAIWSKKNPGCGLTGTTTQTVYDTSPQYGSPGIPYTVRFQTAANTPVFVAVNIQNTTLVPSDAATQIQNAIIAAFAGTDGGLPAQIGMSLVSSRFTAGLLALGSWSKVLSVQFSSTGGLPVTKFTASVAGTTMTVSAIASGVLSVGEGITGANISAGTTIVAQLTGTTGSTGTYQVTVSQTAASAACNGFVPNKFAEIIDINQMPTVSAPYITTNLL